jgi:hypothetical protein
MVPVAIPAGLLMRFAKIPVVLLSLSLVPWLAACTGPRAFIRQGDAGSVEVGYVGDPARALPLATQHCAGYERKPLLATVEPDTVVFNCVGR